MGLQVRRALPRLAIAVVVAALAGCAYPESFGRIGRWLAGSSAAPAAPALPPVTIIDADSTELPWARSEEYLIIVKRTCRTLELYHWGQLLRSYPAVFGVNPLGSKLYEGDKRTPAGYYTIIEKRPHPRWARFMLLDYPNSTDGQRYLAALDAGELPEDVYGAPGIGGAIGIHGSDKEDLNRGDIDWTLGCISLTNHDARELDAIVPVGTPVWIQE
jgi:murein L,D-transpeptidase YafK